MSVPLTNQVITFAVFIALALLMMENGFTEFSYELDCLVTQGLVFFISCYFGTRMTDCSTKVSEVVYNLV